MQHVIVLFIGFETAQQEGRALFCNIMMQLYRPRR